MTVLDTTNIIDAADAADSLKPRCYQIGAIDAIQGRFAAGDSRTLLVIPTGGGKTIVAAHVAREMLSRGRVMVICHRDELVRQAVEKFAAVTGLVPAVEKAGEYSDEESLQGKPQVVVSSVQTLNSGTDQLRRFHRFSPMEFSFLWVDEAHHAPASTWTRVIDYFTSGNPALKVLGVTATPDRADGEALGQVFQSVAFCYSLPDAIHDGYLVPVRQNAVIIEGLDLSLCRNVANDLNAGDLERAVLLEKPLHGVCHATIEVACGVERHWLAEIRDRPDRLAVLKAALEGKPRRRTLIFCVSVAHAQKTAEILNRWIAGSAEAIDGGTPREKRRKILEKFASGETQFLVNCQVACLDDETEILTSEGWRGVDDISYVSLIANWDHGSIYFAPPKNIIRRQRAPDEPMIVLDTPRRSIRVTGNHRMVCRRRYGQWEKIDAAGLVGVAGELPVSGIALPRDVLPPAEVRTLTNARRVSANAYVIRQRRPGLSIEESKLVATEEIDRSDALRRCVPAELTEDDCQFIGFWLGDGTRTKLASGGVEYKVFQSAAGNPAIVKWFDELVGRMGVSCRRHSRIQRSSKCSTPREFIDWSFCRGTGFGPQRRRGIYGLEPYLDKDGAALLWGLDVRQFGALVHGLWMADGNHGDGKENAHGVCIYSANKKMLDHLQAIAVCRGFRASIRSRPNGANLLYCLSLRAIASHSMTKHTLAIEPGWKQERVWCVTTDSGNIVTRRRGSVTIMGNCEGFDSPGIELVVMARPTKSRALYAQMAGRGTRPAGAIAAILGDVAEAAARVDLIRNSAKPFVEILDFVGNAGRHKLVSAADILGDGRSEEVIERAREIAEEGAIDLDEAFAQAELEEEARQEAKQMRAEAEYEKLLEEEEARRQEALARRAGLVGTAIYHLKQVSSVGPDSADSAGGGAASSAVLSTAPKRGGATEKQIAFLQKLGVRPETAAGYSLRQASAVIADLKEKTCTAGQRWKLRTLGYGDAEIEGMNFARASEAIDAATAEQAGAA